MKRTLNILAVATALGCLTVASAWAAQADSHSNSNNTGQTPNWRFEHMFNPRTVETIRGQVLRVETTTHGQQHGVQLVVKTESGTIPVFLGPRWFIDNQETHIRPKEEVAVTGSKITWNGQPALVASEVRAHGQLLRLRNPYGHPVWAAWGPENRPGERRGTGMRGQGMGPAMMNQGMGGSMMGEGMGEEMMGQGHGSAMRGQGMQGRNMTNRRGWMMAQNRPMLSHLREMQANLNKKVEQMNQATGQQEIKDMAGVLNELVHQRNELLNHIAARREQMMGRMQSQRGHMQGMMGGAEAGTGGWSHSSHSSQGNQH